MRFNGIMCLWQREHRSPKRIKQHILDLYWWAERVGRGWIFPPEFILPTTKLAPALANPAWSLSPMNRLPEQRQELALLLMEAFGLTLGEAVQLNVGDGHSKDYLVVTPDIAHHHELRRIPIISKAQRNLLRRIEELGAGHPLLATPDTVAFHQAKIERECERRVLRPLIGLRYWYAQRRYSEMTGMLPPLAGGRTTWGLPPNLRDQDNDARFLLIAELGLTSFDELLPFLG